MASINLIGANLLADDLRRLAALPSDLQDEMLRAKGVVVMAAQKRAGHSMRVEDTGMMLDSIALTGIKQGKSSRCIYITFDGSRTRGKTSTRNAEIAFINEFGRHGQSARPFVAVANEQNASAATQAAYEIYDKYLSEHNL